MSKAEQMKKLKTGKGIQHLLDEGYKILKNPINTFDTDYRLIAYTETSLDDRFWNELITTGTFDFDAQMFFMNECFTDEVANAEKLALMKSDKLKYDRILGHIYNGNGIKVANVLMFESNGAFTPDSIAAFEILAELLTEEIREDAHYIRYGEEYQDRWIKKLIAYDIEEKGLYSPHVQILYNDFKTNLYLAIVDVSRSAMRHKGLDYIVAMFREKQKKFKYAIQNGFIIMLMSTDSKIFNIEVELEGIVNFIYREKFYVGISSCFENLFELRKYYAEALQALESIKDNVEQYISLHVDDED